MLLHSLSLSAPKVFSQINITALLSKRYRLKIFDGRTFPDSPEKCDILMIDGVALYPLPKIHPTEGPRTVIFGPKCESDTHFYGLHYLFHPRVENVLYLSNLSISEYDFFPNPKNLINPKLKVFIHDSYFEEVKRQNSTLPYVHEFDKAVLYEIENFLEEKLF